MEQSQKKFIESIRSFPGIPVSTVVEVGARDCRETVQFAKEFPQARIYAFECNEETLSLCRKAVEEFPAVTLVEKAVSDTDGKISFFPIDTEKTQTPHADGNPGASSIFRASGKYKAERYVQREIRVESTRLDSFLKSFNIPRIDVLWMDAQGSERKILEGLGDHIRDVKFIHTEVEFEEIYTGQPLFWEMVHFLKRHGFSLFKFTSFSKSFGDGIFIHQSLYRRSIFVSALLFVWGMAKVYSSYPFVFFRKIRKGGV
jgi:FkbM family methyltransferase